MAASYGAVITAVREVIGDGHGSLSLIPASRFVDTLDETANEDAVQRLGLDSRAPFSVRWGGQRKNKASAPVNSNIVLRDFDVIVTVSRTVALAERIDSDARAELEALAADDGDLIAEALERAPNLQQTIAGTPTNLAGDCLSYVNSAARVVRGTPDGAQRVETVHRFVGVMKVTK